MGDLALGGTKARLLGDGLEGVQENCLADPAQPSDEHALLGTPKAQASEQNPKGLDLRISAGECRRARAGTRCVGVADGVHRWSVQTYREFSEIG
jgi:hypothetical protein